MRNGGEGGWLVVRKGEGWFGRVFGIGDIWWVGGGGWVGGGSERLGGDMEGKIWEEGIFNEGKCEERKRKKKREKKKIGGGKSRGKRLLVQ